MAAVFITFLFWHFPNQPGNFRLGGGIIIRADEGIRQRIDRVVRDRDGCARRLLSLSGGSGDAVDRRGDRDLSKRQGRGWRRAQADEAAYARRAGDDHSGQRAAAVHHIAASFRRRRRVSSAATEERRGERERTRG